MKPIMTWGRKPVHQHGVEIMLVLSQPPKQYKATALRAYVYRMHARLEQLHPGVSEPSLARFYRLVLPDEERILERLAELRGLDTVEAAYVKPADRPAVAR
jgi:hypothetical protein